MTRRTTKYIEKLVVNSLKSAMVIGKLDTRLEDHVKDILKGVRSVKEALAVLRVDSRFRNEASFKKEDVKNTVFSSIIRSDLIKHGDFFNEKNAVFYYFDRESNRIFQIGVNPTGDSGMVPFVSHKYGVNASTPEGKHVIETLRTQALTSGTQVEVHSWCHYGRSSKTLYLQNGATSLLKIDGTEIVECPNGTDDVYFNGRTYGAKGAMTLEAVDLPADILDSMLYQHLISTFNLGDNDSLPAEDQRLLLLVALFTFPFYKGLPAKPILVFRGGPGSGKTTALRAVGSFLIREKYQITMNSIDEKDLHIVALQSPFVFIDDIDVPSKSLTNILRSGPTGGSYQKRKLYADLELIGGNIICFWGITLTSTDRYPAELVQRMVIFDFDQLNRFRSETTMNENTLKNLELIWAEYLQYLNKVVALLREEESDGEERMGCHRMADWEFLCRTIGRALNIDDDRMDRIFMSLAEASQGDGVGDSVLIRALDEWVRSPDNDGGWVTAQELHGQLEARSSEFSRVYGSPYELGMDMYNMQGQLKKRYACECKKPKGGRKPWQYRFPKRSNDPQDLVYSIDDETEDDIGATLDYDLDLINTAVEKQDHENVSLVPIDDPLMPCIAGWANSNKIQGQWVTAVELHSVFNKRDGYKDHYESATDLGKKMENIQSELNRYFGMNMRMNTSKKQWEYLFEKPIRPNNNIVPLMDDDRNKLSDVRGGTE